MERADINCTTVLRVFTAFAGGASGVLTKEIALIDTSLAVDAGALSRDCLQISSLLMLAAPLKEAMLNDIARL